MRACRRRVRPSRVGCARDEQVALSHKVLDGCFDGRLVHELGQSPEDGRVCFGWHSVPKVEYMTRPTPGTREDSARLGFDSLPGAEQDGGIEIPLNAPMVTHFGPAGIQWNAPVEPDHVAACLRHSGEKRRRAGAEMNR